MKRPKEISAFNAKTHLSELIRDAEAGCTYIISRRGKPVAQLSPIENTGACDFKKIAASFRKIRQGIKGTIHVRQLIEEGRRH